MPTVTEQGNTNSAWVVGENLPAALISCDSVRGQTTTTQAKMVSLVSIAGYSLLPNCSHAIVGPLPLAVRQLQRRRRRAMAATMDAASAARLARLFAAPSKQGMLELDWAEFEDFVQHVFECAGYAVEKVSSRPKHNVDLGLHAGHIEGKVVARVEVRRYQTARLPRARIWQFHGALLGQGNAPGYIVTTSEFTRPAYDAAEATHGKVKLINGERLIRYIRYVSGSRLISTNGATASLHQPVIAPDYLLDAEAIPRRSPAQTTILAVANNKGGVAKTTTALNVSLVLSLKHKQRVLLVDMDGQHSLTRLLPLPLPLPARPRGRRPATAVEPPPVDAAFLADYFTGDRALPELVRATR